MFFGNQVATEARPEPEDETPDVETPKVETPETEAPDVETPEAETPEAETPETITPDVESQEVQTPEETRESRALDIELPTTTKRTWTVEGRRCKKTCQKN